MKCWAGSVGKGSERIHSIPICITHCIPCSISSKEKKGSTGRRSASDYPILTAGK